jgi:GxxExxY protein
MSENESSDPQTYAIIGAAMEVHRQLGDGFLERVYQGALTIEFASRKVPFAKEIEVPVMYKGIRLECGYRADFVCFGDIIVEIKAIEALGKSHIAQVINYLRATGFRRGLLLNFGSSSLESKRLRIKICVNR